MTKLYDLAIIGGGPAGYAAALTGSISGLKVALIEMSRVGGVCLHKGCIPTKQLLEVASVYRRVKMADSFGIEIDTESGLILNWKRAVSRKDEVVSVLEKGLTSALKKRGVEVIDAVGRVVAPGCIEFLREGQSEGVLESRAIFIATGSRPKSVPGLDVDGERVITSNEALSAVTIPEKIAIVGAGAIGVEFASMFGSLGSEVTLLEAMPEILPGADHEIANYLARILKKSGIAIYTGIRDISRLSTGGRTSGSTVIRFLDSEGQQQDLEVDQVLVATGRRPASEGLSVDPLEIACDESGYVKVDMENLETSLPNVYAGGDVINTPALAHVGFAEGIRVVDGITGKRSVLIDYSKVPWCIYSHPEVAFVGMTENVAREVYGKSLRIARHRFGGLGRALILGQPEGMIKVLSLENGPLVGVHIVGPMASELLSPGYLGVNLGLTADQLSSLVQPHPTLSEAFGEAVRTLADSPLHG